jgi:hypothetical protein
MVRWIGTFALVAGCFVLTEWLPFSPYFRNLDTMIHEFGHALLTLVLSGDVRYIHLYEDHSGVTLSAVKEGWRLIPVALSGYVTASLFAVLLFYMVRHDMHRTGLLIITAVAFLSLALFVRNAYGIQWLIGFIGINVFFLLFPVRWLRAGYVLFLAFLSLTESVTSAVTIAVMSWLEPGRAGDATQLARMTGIVAPVWGGLFALFALWAAMRAIRYFAAPKKQKKRKWASIGA